ncbi:ACP phosphodiesterase, partial [Aeromonas hydrophila]
MNYLAHLHLAAHTHSSLTGNLLGDFVKGALARARGPAQDEGLMLQPQYKPFNDTHPQPQAGVARIEAATR